MAARESDAAPSKPERPPLSPDPTIAVIPGPRRPFDAVAFRQLGERGYMDWPIFEAYNLDNRKIASLGVVGYAYDKDGKQVVRTQGSRVIYGINIEPGKSVVISQIARAAGDEAPMSAVSYELCYDQIWFEGDPKQTTDASQCPDIKPRRSPKP
ncbi:MAG TPA: hypothetical protein VFE97_00010 [Methylomirabilota bacterium]|nr:hypothetical protein [Methylomirabilota bacterium]